MFYKNVLLYSECADLTYYQRNRDVILNRADYYYENDKERLREQARDKCRNLSEEGKNVWRHLSEENKCLKEKQRLNEYQKNYREAKKSQYNNNK